MTVYRVTDATSVWIVPNGLMFQANLTFEGGTALQFVPCSPMQAKEFVSELEERVK